MRPFACALQLLLATAAVGCGDGVGHPILEPARESAVAFTGGSGGAAAAAGGSVDDTGTPAADTEARPGAGNGGADFGPPRGAGSGGWDGREARRPFEKGLVPDNPACESVADWDTESDEIEQQLVQYLNFARESGFACEPDNPEPAGPLEVSPELRCAARLHSRDMSERGFFDHVNPDGIGPEERMRRSGAAFRVASESITRVDEQEGPGGWQGGRPLSGLLLVRGTDCKNLADPGFDRVGVGLYDGLLTLDFAGP